MKYTKANLPYSFYSNSLLIFLLLPLVLAGCKLSNSETTLPSIQEIHLPMPDGVQLTVDLYVPHDFDESSPYPIILEYLPYWKDEHRKSWYGVFNYFVQAGYRVARVDIRSTGRSEGTIVPYEYSDQELDDAFSAAPDFTLDSAYFRDRFYSAPWLLKYKQQQHDGTFWDRASLNSHYEGFDTPTFLIEGMYDGYRDLVECFFAQTQSQALIGPWNHTWPHRNAYFLLNLTV